LGAHKLEKLSATQLFFPKTSPSTFPIISKMATTNPEAERAVPVNEVNRSSVEKKEENPSHEDLRSQDADVEIARKGADQHPRMTFKRFMAIFSLGCLLAAAQIPIYLIGGALCNSFFSRIN
jgi:hypothetical protein